MQGRRKWGAEGALAPPIFGQTVNPISTRGLRGLWPLQYFAKQLTLSQPGGQIMPTTVLQAPRIF